nr:hypothetical protein [Tanacetum cinerariifolium]
SLRRASSRHTPIIYPRHLHPLTPSTPSPATLLHRGPTPLPPSYRHDPPPLVAATPPQKSFHPPSPSHLITMPPPRHLFQLLSPPWRAVGGGSVTTATANLL